MPTVGEVAIIVPVLGRAHLIGPLLDSIDATAPDARVLFCTTPTDRPGRAAVAKTGRAHLDVPWHPMGDYARKINAGFRATTEPLIFLGATDLLFHPGWLQAAAAHLTDGIGVVGTNDLGSPRVMAGEHATHSLVTREYVTRYGTIDEPGKVLHEGYWHEYVDDEMVATAKHRRAWAYAADSHVEHMHPSWKKAPVDAMYAANQPRMTYGRAVYRRREHLWT